MLMVAVANGDRSAFADLYDELAPKVFAIMTLFAADRDPEEASVEAMVEMWRAAPTYAPSQGSARSWCLKIAARQAIHTHRSTDTSGLGVFDLDARLTQSTLRSSDSHRNTDSVVGPGTSSLRPDPTQVDQISKITP